MFAKTLAATPTSLSENINAGLNLREKASEQSPLRLLLSVRPQQSYRCCKHAVLVVIDEAHRLRNVYKPQT
jgi:hypothetical protein